MTRRDILKRLVAFAACARAFAKTPDGAGLIVVKIGERHSDICLVRRGVELALERIPIGRAHFVNDVACCLGVEREHASELVEKYGMRPSASRKLLAEIVEARAVEFSGFIRDTLKAAGAGDAKVILAGDGRRIAGLAEVM